MSELYCPSQVCEASLNLCQQQDSDSDDEDYITLTQSLGKPFKLESVLVHIWRLPFVMFHNPPEVKFTLMVILIGMMQPAGDIYDSSEKRLSHRCMLACYWCCLNECCSLWHWCLFCYYLFMALEWKSHFNRNIHVGVPVGQS